MNKHYDPKEIEAKWYPIWMERGLFHSDSEQDGEPYCVMIPPPNVTGILHMGHALNNAIQDIMVRWRRMQGRNTIWMPGTDHAGIATQNVVERALKKENLSREDLGRDAFIERVWDWRKEYGGTIVNQLKCLGASCDWERERFTMDEGLSESVTEVFVRLYEKGLIYRGNYIVNWCSRCHTALSDEESEHQDCTGKLYHIRYPVEGADGEKAFLTVATTRPETLLGDVAVAINPTDERYAWLEGKTVILPILDRELTVIKDSYVDVAFGTGVVKVTPAHDPNDFDMGQRHNLTPINVMNGDGTMNEEAGPYAGMDRFDCRKQIVKDLDEAGLLEKIDDHQHAVGHCYRCDTVVEPRLSPQWFVKMKPLAGPAIEAVTSGKVKFTPQRWEKVYLSWMENIRDWCISRQIWWGHRIPVFYCDSCEKEWAARENPDACPACGSKEIRQDPDVLDTWFSSWLWPFSTLGWPNTNPDLACYYPTHDLVTASEIIFFWVARMVMAGIEFMGDVPFRDVYIHGTVRDDKGRKMSKSLGNSIDPLSVIEEYSADALRFSLIAITATGQDVYVNNEKFEMGRNFGTKIWNAARFMQMHREKLSKTLDTAALVSNELTLDESLLSNDDRHLLDRAGHAVAEVNDLLGRYRFNDAALAVYEFVWHQYCDWYLESVKHILYGEDEACREQTLRIMYYALGVALRLLHPFMPFVTEELWHELGYAAEEDSIMTAPWPDMPKTGVLAPLPGIVEYVEGKHELVRAGRMLRADYGIAPGKSVDFVIRVDEEKNKNFLLEDSASLSSLLKTDTLDVAVASGKEKAMPSVVTPIGTIYLPLAGIIDVDAELEKLQGQLDKVQSDLSRVKAKLSNENFVSRAPAEVVQVQRDREDELLETLAKLERMAVTLKAAE